MKGIYTFVVVVVVFEMQWSQSTQSINFYQMISCKITEKIYTWEKLESVLF